MACIPSGALADCPRRRCELGARDLGLRAARRAASSPSARAGVPLSGVCVRSPQTAPGQARGWPQRCPGREGGVRPQEQSPRRQGPASLTRPATLICLPAFCAALPGTGSLRHSPCSSSESADPRSRKTGKQRGLYHRKHSVCIRACMLASSRHSGRERTDATCLRVSATL